MNKKAEAKFKIEALEIKLHKWAKEYYELNQPSVSDATYDANYQTLIKLLKEYPEFTSPFSITKQIGGQVSNKFDKVQHQYPMLSLDNAFNDEDLYRFDKHIKNQLGLTSDIEYVCELKIDGLSISLHYDNGKLVQALTRGDGVVGENVLSNILTIKDVPHQITFKEKIEFRGEVYMSYQAFNKLNEISSQSFANPRNAAAGTLRQLNANIVKSRNLSTFFYMIPNPLKFHIKKQSDVLKFIKNKHLSTNHNWIVVQGIDHVIKALHQLYALKSELNYDVDGMVVKVNDLTLYEDIGSTAKYPKFMIAYKFPEEIVTTILLDIFPTIGRTGRVTYNAKLAPVKIGGSTISSATLHNSDYVKERNINIGDQVKVKKSGEVIPRVLGVEKKHNHNQWIEATHCPYCHEQLVRIDGEVDQYCINNNCPQRLVAALEHFCAKSAMDIVGLSDSTIKTFITEKLITDIPSIYELYLHREKIINLYRFKEKSTDNILRAIEKSKTPSLDRFLFALGIRHVGAKVSLLLARRFRTLDNIMNVTEQQISQILSLGPAVGNAITQFFNNDANVKMIKRYLSLGVKPQALEQVKSTKLENLTFVLTGELSKPRQYFQDLIEINSGNVSNSVSKNSDYVVAGVSSGSKLTKAYQLNVKVIDENTLLKMIDEND